MDEKQKKIDQLNRDIEILQIRKQSLSLEIVNIETQLHDEREALANREIEIDKKERKLAVQEEALAMKKDGIVRNSGFLNM